MPILESNGATADLTCQACGTEQRVTPADWRTSDDPSALTAPPCPGCGATETFSWHDWVYVRDEFDDETKGVRYLPDPDNFGARQMAHVARVAAARGRTRRQTRNQVAAGYPREPQASTREEGRAWAQAHRPRVGTLNPRDEGAVSG